jgi:hypothetical protein
MAISIESILLKNSFSVCFNLLLVYYKFVSMLKVSQYKKKTTYELDSINVKQNPSSTHIQQNNEE